MVAAVLSSALGGVAVAVTRHAIGATDAVTLGALRFGTGVVFLALLAWLLPAQRGAWPARGDRAATVALGLLFFAAFPFLFNEALKHTTAARGALALSTLPLLTMAMAAAAGVEPLTRRRTIGVLLAVSGVATALASSLDGAPAGAWRGDLLMVGAAACMALYNVGSRPIIRRSGPVAFTLVAMAAGAACLTLLALARGGFAGVQAFGAPQWIAVLYLGLFGSAFAFFLWAYALERVTPTAVAVSVTVNPVTASLVAALWLHEALRGSLAFGLAMVVAGIVTATGPARARS